MSKESGASGAIYFWFSRIRSVLYFTGVGFWAGVMGFQSLVGRPF